MNYHQKKFRYKGFIGIILFLLLTVPLMAVTQPQQYPSININELSVKGKVLLSEIDKAERFNMAYPLIDIQYGNEASFQNKAWLDFLNEYGTGWRVMWDTRAGRPNLIEGKGIPFYSGKGNALQRDYEKLTIEYLDTKIKNFLQTHQTIFRIDFSKFILNKEGSHIFSDGRYSAIQYDYRMDEVPVEGARLFFRFNNGNLIQFGSLGISDITLSGKPAVSEMKALENVADAFSTETVQVTGLSGAVLQFVQEIPSGQNTYSEYTGMEGNGITYRLIYRVQFQRGADYEQYEAWVDAQTGQIVNYWLITLFANVHGNISFTPTDRRERTFPSCGVTNNGSKITNFWGYYDYTSSPSATATSTLSGDLHTVTDTCGAISLSTNGSPGTLDFGSSLGTDCSTPGTGGAGNTYPSRSSSYHAEMARYLAHEYLSSLAWLTDNLPINTNKTDMLCNAYWSDGGGSINFEQSIGNCNNSGEVAGIIHHEWGHGLDYNDGGPGKVPSNEGSSGEAYADMMGILLLKDPCAAQGFFQAWLPGQCGPCPADCLGTRYLAYRFDDDNDPGTPDVPVMPSNIENDNGVNCDTAACPNPTCRGLMGYECHCESYIASNALWDMVANLRTEDGEAGMAWANMLWFESASQRGSAYRINSGGECNPAASINGCGAANWYTVIAGVDDDNGNLSDGTPHGGIIWDAFNIHGIACGARPATHDICTEPSAPESLHIAGSDHEVGLTWEPSSNATGYRIYVDEYGGGNCNAGGWIPIADITEDQNYYTIDEMVNGYNHVFAVQAINGSDDCVSGFSNCVNAEPTSSANAVNLTGKKTKNWDYVLVPTNLSCTTEVCHRPSILNANGNKSYLHYKIYNNSTVNAGSYKRRIYLDGTSYLNGTVDSHDAHVTIAFINLDAMIKGGRHVLTLAIDADDEINETVETDNNWSTTAVYSPYDLDADTDHVLIQSAPPDRDPIGYTAFSCDGYAFSVVPGSGAQYWGAVGMLPSTSTANYDLRLHDDYTDSSHGFKTNLEWSSQGGNGEVEIVGVNRRTAGNAVWAGVIQGTATPSASTYSVQRALSGTVVAVPSSGRTGVIPYVGVLAVEEIYAGSEDLSNGWVIEVTPNGGDIGLALIDSADTHFKLTDAITGTKVNDAGSNGIEQFAINFPHAGYYGLLIYKPDSTALTQTISYTLNIFQEQPNLMPYTVSSWTSFVVPRTSTGCSISSCDVPSSLPTGTSTIYLNSTSINNGGTDINSTFTVRYMLDDVELDYINFSYAPVGSILLDVDNSETVTVKGGKHTLGLIDDAMGVIEEYNEIDNEGYEQYNWAPGLLTNDVPYTSTAPPDKDPIGYVHYNCDGYRFQTLTNPPSDWWHAVGTLPVTSAANYNLRLNDDYNGPTQGFDTQLTTSNSGNTGEAEIVLINRHQTALTTMWANVVQSASTPASVDYVIEKVASGPMIDIPVTGSAGFIPANSILAIREINIDSGDLNLIWTFTVAPSGGDIAVALFPPGQDYFALADAITGTRINNGGYNQSEVFSYVPTVSGSYGFVIYKAVTSQLDNDINFAITITVAESNLRPYLHTGWTAPVVPRDAGGCTISDCTVTATLPGWSTAYTFFSSSGINDGPNDITTLFYIMHTLDDMDLDEYGKSSLAVGETTDRLNFNISSINGGRHTLGIKMDAYYDISESNESDNGEYAQYVWSPLALNRFDPRPVSWGPPDRDSAGYYYYNCDGFEFTAVPVATSYWWTAVGMIPFSGTADFDLRLHDDYTGSTQGFGTPVTSSGSNGAGAIEIVGVNRHITSTSTWWAGVIQHTGTRSSSGYILDKASSLSTVNVPSTGTNQVISASSPLRLEDIYVGSADLNKTWKFTITPTGGDIAVALIPNSNIFFTLADAIYGTKVNNGGTDEPEVFTFKPTATGYYGLVIYKPDYTQISETITYVLNIEEVASNIKPYTHTGWTYPVVPRNTSGCTQSSCTLTTTLPGWSGNTYLNSTTLNEGPDTIADSFVDLYYIDDVEVYVSTVPSLLYNATWYDLNRAISSVKGGRHTLGFFADADNEYNESNETDNKSYDQYIWSPKLLTDNVPYTCPTAPPDRDSTGYTQFNSDGYEFHVVPGGGHGYWGVVGLMPSTMLANYDLRLYDDYADSTHGFSNYLKWSNVSGNGGPEIIGVNRHMITTETWWAGVIQASSDPDVVSYIMHNDNSDDEIAVPSLGYTGFIPSYGIVAVEEINVGTNDVNVFTRFTVTPDGSDIAIALIDASAPYFSLADAVPGTVTNANGINEPEHFEYSFTAPGRYAILIYKPAMMYVDDAVTYTIDIETVKSNLRPQELPLWDGSIVPRDATFPGCSNSFCSVSAELPGWNSTTYVSSIVYNEGPVAVNDPFDIRYTIDDVAAEEFEVTSLMSFATNYDLNSALPIIVKGGRHTLGLVIDANEEYSEINESDNTRYKQYIWKPKIIASNTGFESTAPPDRDSAGYYYYNNDGYQFSITNSWGIFALVSKSPLDNYDLGLYNDYTGSTAGFGAAIDASQNNLSRVDFILVNGNAAGAGPWYAGVVQGTDTPHTGDYAVSFRDNFPLISPPSVNGPYGMSTSVIANAHFLHIPSLAVYKIKLNIIAGNTDLGFALYNADADHRSSDEIFGSSFTNNNGAGGDEYLRMIIPAGNYILAVFKPNAVAYTSATDVLYNLILYSGPLAETPDNNIVAGIPLTITKLPSNQLELNWGNSCDYETGITHYEIYRGTIASLLTGTYNHGSLTCDNGTSTTATIPAGLFSFYYLIVPTDTFDEGGYGYASGAVPRPAAESPCHLQNRTDCP